MSTTRIRGPEIRGTQHGPNEGRKETPSAQPHTMPYSVPWVWVCLLAFHPTERAESSRNPSLNLPLQAPHLLGLSNNGNIRARPQRSSLVSRVTKESMAYLSFLLTDLIWRSLRHISETWRRGRRKYEELPRNISRRHYSSVGWQPGEVCGGVCV